MKTPRDPDFDASADMRLIDLKRESLGVPAPKRGAWEANLGTEGAVSPETPAQRLATAVLVCEMTATPPSQVIPGAIVTIALGLANEGAVPAREVRVTVPLPGTAGYRNGSFQRDGRQQRDEAAEELFTTGTIVPELPPKARATFLWKIGVRIGNKPLVMTPAIDVKDAAVIGGETLVISRKEGAQSTFASEVGRAESEYPEPAGPQIGELPIYELDAEEMLEHEAAEAALSGIAEYVPANPPPAPEPVPAPSQPEPAPAPDRPEPVPEPVQPPEPEPSARQAIVLAGQIDRPSLAYFERIFTGAKAPSLLNHFILGGALACTRLADGSDPAGLKAHLDAQAQLLQRIVLHEKLGKKEPIAEYAGEMLARAADLTPQPVPEPAKPIPNAVLLQAELDGPTLNVLTKMQEEIARWDFTKARQMTLALQARSVVANAPPEAVERADAALRAYARTAALQLQRFFVRMRIERTTGVLFTSDETLDAAAKTLIAALVALF